MHFRQGAISLRLFTTIATQCWGGRAVDGWVHAPASPRLLRLGHGGPRFCYHGPGRQCTHGLFAAIPTHPRRLWLGAGHNLYTPQPAMVIASIPKKIKIAPTMRTAPKDSPSQPQPTRAARTMLTSRSAPT